MTTYNWVELRDHAIEAFAGDLPGDALEETILRHFEREPARVATAIDQIGKQVAAGKIRSGWAILIRELGSHPKDVQASDNAERAKQLILAETWITNAGGYIDREDELLSELFDQDIGKLRHWPDLKPRMLELWQSQRPRFIAAEAASVERQHEQAASLKRIRAASSTTSTDIDSSEHAGLIAAAVNHARYGVDPHRDDWLDQIAATHTEVEAA